MSDIARANLGHLPPLHVLVLVCSSESILPVSAEVCVDGGEGMETTLNGTIPDKSVKSRCFPARCFSECLLGVTNGAVCSSLQLE